MRSLAIVWLCVAAAVAYGVVHDQVTARVCVEYFTIGHPPLVPTTNATLLGLAWGVVATWWAGLISGVPLAIAARASRRPKLTARDLARSVARLLCVMAASALVTGTIGYMLAREGLVWLDGPLAVLVPPDRHARFLADLWAHTASYAVGFFGGLVVCALTWRRRGRLAIESTRAHSATVDSTGAATGSP
jgi:hypothetical protein